MIKKSFLLGAIGSIITTNAIANQVITSQTYVDNADALKVNIAQGVGTNNANVGKTLVVNSSGNLELGAPAAGNYVEDSITDGVTTKAPSENAVSDALDEVYDELDYKQNLIPTGNWTPDSDAGDYVTTTLVTYDDGEISGNVYGIATPEAFANVGWQEVDPGQGFVEMRGFGEGNLSLENTVPSTAAVVAGFEYIKDQLQLPTGTANTVVMYNNSGAIGGSRAIYDGSATYNATNDATKLVTANGVSKMKECTRWIDNAAHTDENCLLWRLP